MDLGSVLSAAETLFSALQNPKLQEALSIFGYKSQLDDLQDTVETIKAVLRDAETKQELSQQDQILIEKLKNAVFEADDLFDEFATLAEQKQLLEADGSLSKKVGNFFSRSKNPLSLAYRMSRGVKKIKKKLDAIAYNQQFSFKIDPEPTRKRRPETCSYVNEVDIIGREHDLEYIVGMLLASNDQRDLSVLSIVGIGGLGKTALAQLVFNNKKITEAFQLKMWTCVSDQDQKELDVKDILGKILGHNQEGSTTENVQSQLRAQLAGKKYLLVLDDLWTEKRDQWCELVKYFIGNNRGSWIVVTTRSQKTATITGGVMHELLGLSKESSWRLFERTAFTSDQSNPPDDLVKTGQNIVDGCAGVPLAIRVAGSLLYGQDENKWLSVQKMGLANIRDEDNGIMPILELSFHHLEFPLKNCFRYCALFPKDYVIEKEKLINLWMAQGYIIPLDKSQSIEDAGEEYFSLLLKRCFFQDVEKDRKGEIKSCKIHDLMHDLAQNVSGREIYALDTVGRNANKNIRHLSIFRVNEYEKYYTLGKNHIRSLLTFHYSYHFQLAVDALVGSFRCLRVLDASDKNIISLPDSIGELLHLRYIDLSRNRHMEALPNSVTKLCNLQTLILHGCRELRWLPKDLSRLAKLRVLDIKNCFALCWMPRSMGKLTCLHTLKGAYRVGGGGERCTSWKQWLDGLEDLKTLNSLKGELTIDMWWPKNAKNDVNDSRKGGLYLRSMEHVNHICMNFKDKEGGGGTDEGITMRLMEDLRPHSNLKRLTVDGYLGVKMPGWVTATLLPHLVKLHLEDCKELEYLPCLGNLCHLKSLHLFRLLNLKYIEEDTALLPSTAKNLLASSFPSLEKLYLYDLPKFKGWRGVDVEESSIDSNMPRLQRCLSRLKKLIIDRCPELTCILLCPMLETLTLKKFNDRLQIYCKKAVEQLSEAAIENPENLDSNVFVPELREVRVSNGGWLNSMPVECFHSLQRLIILLDDEMEDLPNCMVYMSALQTLELQFCKKLKAMPNWMPKLTSLRHLTLHKCSESLKNRCRRDPPGDDWPYIQHIPHIEILLSL